MSSVKVETNKVNIGVVVFTARILYLVTVLSSNFDFKKKLMLIVAGNLVENFSFSVINFDSFEGMEDYKYLNNFYEAIQNTLLYQIQISVNILPKDQDNILKYFLILQYIGTFISTVTRNMTYTILFPDLYIEGLFSFYFFRKNPKLVYIFFGVMVFLKIYFNSIQISFKHKKLLQATQQLVRNALIEMI